MNGIVYDEASEFFKSNKEDSDMLDAMKQLIYQTGKQFGKAADTIRQSFHDFPPAMDFHHNFIIAPAELERQKRRERFLAQRAACLHGERAFPIHWSDEALASIGGYL